MHARRAQGSECLAPFPVHEGLVETLLAAHAGGAGGRDATVAHVLGTCAGYVYSDVHTVATIMARLGLAANGCSRVVQTVDAMFIFSTAYLVQSRCGRVVILCYRGTEPATLGNWIGDADVGSEYICPGTDPDGALRVHAGFHRNMRATRWEVLNELELALQGRSLANPDVQLAHPMQALYLAGHSLGGAMALLFALSLGDDALERAVSERLRAIYTFGQPLAVGASASASVDRIGHKLFRHLRHADPVPALPPAAWGRLVHCGHEYRFANGEWTQPERVTEQQHGLRGISSALFALFATEKRRASMRYSISEHGPHHYIAALRPGGRVTEFGDHASHDPQIVPDRPP